MMKRLLLMSHLALLPAMLSVADVSKVFDTNDFIPLESDSYWSYIGEVDTDSETSIINLRREVDSTAYVDGNRTTLVTQEVIPALAEISDEIESISRKAFESVGDGNYLYREEYEGNILEYNRPVRLVPCEMVSGKSYKYKTRIDPDYGNYGIVSFHTVVIGEVALTLRNGDFTALKLNQERRIKLASDEDMEEIVSDRTEYISNYYVEGVGLVRQEYMSTDVTNDGSSSVKYAVDLVASDSLPNYLWPDATTTGDGWKFVDWLGYLTDDYFPWIYHSEHGWMYVDALDKSDVRLWSESLGWWFTSSDLYPTFYSHDLGDWLTFETDASTVERTFVRNDGTVVTASNAGFRFSANNSKPPTPSSEASTEKDGDQVFVDEDGNRYVDTESGIEDDPGDLPEVELIYPYDQKEVEPGEKIILLADAKDKDGVIKWVKFYVNGRLVGMVEDEPFQTVIEIDDETESYEIYAQASDNYNNETETDPITLISEIEDPKEPKIRVASPMNKTYYALGRRVYVTLEASDADGFVEEVGLLVDDIQVGDVKTQSPYTFDFIPPVKGSYSIGGFAIDDDETETKAQKISIVVNDTGVPEENSSELEARIIEPLNGQEFAIGEAIPITVAATDTANDIDRLRVLVNGQQIGNSVSSGYYQTTYYPPSGLTGTITIQVEARNTAYQTDDTSISVIIGN